MLNLGSYNNANSLTAQQGSVKEQTPFLAQLERACIDNPDLPSSFVANCLLSITKPMPQDLTPFVPRTIASIPSSCPECPLE